MKTWIILLIFIALWMASVPSFGVTYCDDVDPDKFKIFCYVENLECWDYCERVNEDKGTCSVGNKVNINGTIYECKEK